MDSKSSVISIKASDVKSSKVVEKALEKADEKKKTTKDLFKIKKLKYAGDKELPKNNLHESFIIPNHPFRAMMLAPSKGGKSTLICNLLCKTIFYKNFFDNIFVFSPTVNVDMSYDCLKDKKVAKKIEFFDELDAETLEGIVSELKEAIKEIIAEDDGKKSDCPQTLFIFDDFVSNTTLLNSKVFKDIFIYGRHLCTSTIVSTQAYRKFPLTLRHQLSNVFIFDLSARESKVVAEELCPSHIGPKEFTEVLNNATTTSKDDPNPFLHINIQEPNRNKMFRKNLDTYIDISDPQKK